MDGEGTSGREQAFGLRWSLHLRDSKSGFPRLHLSAEVVYSHVVHRLVGGQSQGLSDEATGKAWVIEQLPQRSRDLFRVCLTDQATRLLTQIPETEGGAQ